MDPLRPVLVSQDSDELLRLAFWAGNIGFWNWDLVTNDVYLSPIWKSQLGYEDHELPNAFSTWESLLHPDDIVSSWTVINEAKSDPSRMFEIHFRLRHKDNHYRTILSRGRVYRNEAGVAIRIMGCHVDITQQKATEEELRQSETRLQLALQSADMGTWEWKLDSTTAHWDEKQCEIFHRISDNGTVPVSSFYDSVHADDKDRVKKQVEEVLSQHDKLHTEFRIILPDGTIRWLLGDGCLIHDKLTGKPVSLIGINYDITAIKNALISSQEAHEFNKQIIEFAQEGIIVYDEELRYRVWNRHMEQISGRLAADVLGKKTLDIFPFLESYGIIAKLERALSGEVIIGEDIQFFDTRDNTYHWTTARYGPLRDVQGKTIGVVATIREITDRKSAEERISSNKQRLELIVAQIPSILWTTDLHLVFTSSTGSGLKHLNLVPESVLGMSLYQYLQTEDTSNPSIHAHLEALAGHSMTYDIEFQDRCFHVFVVPLRNTQSELIGTIGLAIDITENRKREKEQRELELRVQQAQKLESLEVLAGGIAHDFNNLLTGMLGYASLAISELPSKSPVVGMLKEIEKAAQRAAELSRQMLAYSGKGKFVIEPIHLDQLVIEMVNLLKTLVSPKAQLHVVAEPAVIEGDSTQIRQVVMNLITNAADAIQKDGIIAIRTGIRHFRSDELKSDFMQSDIAEGTHAFLEVQDNGSGIASDVLKRIFDPFFTTKFTGRGLGLASVRGIIRGHNGIIQVVTIRPHGTLFRVILPLASNTGISMKDPPSERISEFALGSILVVEDDASVLDFIRIVLEQAGYRVIPCNDSRNALDAINHAATPITAVVIDFTMPYLNGLQLSQLIRSSQPHLPMLLMSGYAEDEVTGQLGEHQVNSFLQKPFKPKELLTRIASMINNTQPQFSR